MKILCLDGGGVYGVGQAHILGKADVSKFDCFVGTSIGSAVASVLAFQLDLGLVSFFHEWMPKVFHRRLLRYYNPFTARYSDDGLNAALKAVFQGRFFHDSKKPLFITSANVGSRTLKVFNWKNDNGWLLWEIVRCATAAETYFPSWKGYADGGVFANNPSMVGVAAASRVLGCRIEDMEVLSIGTGDRTGAGSGRPSTVIGWGIWLVDALLDGASDKMHDYFVRSMSLKKYERIQFAAGSDWRMDSVDDMKKAERVWKPDIERAIKAVEAF